MQVVISSSLCNMICGCTPRGIFKRRLSMNENIDISLTAEYIFLTSS